MEAPKKIKIGKHNITSDGDVIFGWVTNNPDCEAMQHDIEYIRTDAFIEKAAEWLKENAANFVSKDNEGEPYLYRIGLADEFIKAMML